MRRILFLRGGALGDFIVTLPALAALRRRWPAARIEFAGNATAASLALSRGLVDAVHSQHEARWSALYGSAPLSADFAGWLGSFDLVMSFWPDPEDELRQRFPLHAAQRFLAAPAMPDRAPAAAHYCAALRPLGIEARDVFFPLAPLVQTTTPAAPRIAIHPGSGSPRKNWPAAHWREMIAALPGPLSLIVGEVELATWRDFEASHVEKIARASLEDLVAQLAPCRLFLGHDSGVAHLAAASGVPCVLLFGPSDPAMWAPPAPHVRVLRHGPDPGSIPVSDVLAAAHAALADGR